MRISRCFFSNAVVNEDNVGKSGIVIEDNIWQRFSSWSIDLNYGGNTNIVIRNNIFLRSYLHAHNTRAVPREEILAKVWGYANESLIETRTVDIHIAKLRKKIEADPKAPQVLLTVRGAGYKLHS